MIMITLTTMLMACGPESETTATTSTSGTTVTTTATTGTTQTSTTPTGTTQTTATTTTHTDTTVTYEQDFAPDDAALVYTGRWDHSKPSAPWCAWQGCSVSFNFRGTSASVTLDAGNKSEYFRAIIDGDEINSLKFEAKAGNGTYLLADELDLKDHSVTLVKETLQGSTSTLHGISIIGSDMLEPPALPSRSIEFYGDSNLAGWSLESEQNENGWFRVGEHFTYGGLVSRAFGAIHQNNSVSGASISYIHDRYDRINPSDSSSGWDFPSNPADLVVVNLGANDIYGGSPQNLKNDYNDFLDDLRQSHPDAHIMLFNAWGWDDDEPANYIHEVIAGRGDENMSSAIFPWLFEQWHGSEYDHAGMAAVLIEHVEETLGWKAGPVDIFNAFGVDGDVANGGFEHIAPFGGYGWRYYSDDGVERVIDVKGAHSGEAYLSLSNGAETHQPNPCVNGQTVTATVWMKGAANDVASVTIDFRDQTMWTTPLQTDTWQVELTGGWQQYTLTATAPDGFKSVYHTRLTLEAAAGSEVHIDDIEMITD